jgi:hypothetical protein
VFCCPLALALPPSICFFLYSSSFASLDIFYSSSLFLIFTYLLFLLDDYILC